MILKKSEILEVFNILAKLQGGVFSGKGSYAVNKNLRILRPVFTDIVNAQKLIMDKVPDEQKDNLENGSIMIKEEFKGSPESESFRKENDAFLETEDEVPVHKFNASDLLPEKNNIPSSVFLQIFPLLNEE